MSDLEEENRNVDEDDEVNPAAHKRLLQAIGQLGKNQHIRIPTRSEVALAKDEFHLAKPLSSKVQTVSMGDVVSALKKTSKHIEAGKELSKSQQFKRLLKKPLEKPVAERIQRTIGYEKAKKSLSRWDAVVERNRVAEHQIFPLDYEKVHVNLPPAKIKRNSSIKTDLMKEMEAVEAKLRSLKGTAQSNEDEDEKKLQQRLTREELIARRKELAYLRTKESQKSARARLKNKIKSKKYHKFLKREKLKEQLKEFELLQKTNPEAALEKLESIEKNRVLERASLRHKNTGTWAKNLQVRAKYDRKVRKDLADQLALSRELTQKQKEMEESGSGEEDKDERKDDDDGDYDPFNPWCKGNKKLEQTDEVSEYFSGYRKYWMDRNKSVEALKEFRAELNGKPKDGSQSIEDGDSSKEGTNIETEHPAKDNEECDQDVNKEDSIENSSIKDSEITTDSEEEEKISKFKSLLNDSHKRKKVNSENFTQKNKKSVNIPQKPISKQSKLPSNGDTTECYQLIATKPAQIKRNTIKVPNRKISAGSAGDWIVEDIQKSRQVNDNIDDIFDDAENLLKKKVREKISELSKDLEAKKSNEKDRRQKKQKTNSSDLSFKIRPSRPEIDEELLETPANGETPEAKQDSYRLANSKIDNQTPIENGIDPEKVALIKPKHLRTTLPDMVNSEEFFGEHDADNTAQMTIAEAFEDDDIVADFERDREEERKKSTNEELDLTLPGWGSWAGCGISKEKQAKRLILKFPKDAPRKDDNKQNVYINEDANQKIKHHLVSELPFPFKSVQEYEASIRAPVGRNFVPETAFRLLTRPATVTKLGAIIEPMNDELLVKAPKRPKTTVDKRISKMNKTKKN